MGFGSRGTCTFMCLLVFGSEYWPLLFDRACPLTRDPFLIRPPVPNPPSRLKPGPHLSSIRGGKISYLSEDAPALFAFTLLLLSFFFLPFPLPLSFLFINEYTTLDTKDLTSNEFGNPFSHFGCPFQSFVFFREGVRSVAHRC